MFSHKIIASMTGLTMAIALGAPALAAPDAKAGAVAFKSQCSMCHATVAGKNSLGPSLAGVMNRKPGSAANFAFSPPMRALPGKWDKATLDRFLADPRKTVPGTRMIFVGEKDAAKRANLIAYLATLK